MTNHIHFYDSASPGSIPSGVYAAVYINGFAWPESEVRRMSKVIRVSVQRQSYYAKHARCIDVESGAAMAEDVVPFLHVRLQHGYHDCTAYVNRSNIMDVHERVKRERERIGNDHFTARYWLATLDGSQPTEYEGLRLWAVQYQGGMTAAYDRSVLYGIDDFVRP